MSNMLEEKLQGQYGQPIIQPKHLLCFNFFLCVYVAFMKGDSLPLLWQWRGGALPCTATIIVNNCIGTLAWKRDRQTATRLDRGRQRQMDGQIDRSKQQQKGSRSCKNRYIRQVDRCITDNTFVCQNSRLCVCQTQTDGWSYSRRCTRRSGEGDLYDTSGTQMEWCDRFDWAHVPRRERDSQSWIETDVAEEGLTGRSREGGLHRANGWIEWDNKEW